MSSAIPSSVLVFFLLFFFFFFSLTHSSLALDVPPPSAPVSPSNACSSTPYPSFCQSVLPPQKPGNLYYYGRFSVAKSLSNARKFLGIVNQYLARRSTLSESAIRALEDCQLLSGLNIDFLMSTGATLNSSTNLLDRQTETVATLLSALLTNQQTCLDGLQATASAWSVKNGLSAPLSNGTKLYSVSLALFSRAWKPKQKRMQLHQGFTHGKILTMKRSRHGRRLLQSSSVFDQILVSDSVAVGKDGSGNFTTISEAVASAPNNTNSSNGYFVIYIFAGVYEENVIVPKNKKYLMMIGDGINETVITGNRSVVDGWTTYNSATLAVVGQGFVATNITFRNTAGAVKHQAVAVRNGADLSSFYRCSFEGYQDTLYTHSLRQFYRECDIYGTVDFIFGNAAVVFQNCNIYSRLPMQGQSNTITAQGRTDPNQNTGTSIQNCNFLATPDLSSGNSGYTTETYLGRPWKLYSRTVIMQSFLDSLIDPSGWSPWDGDFALSTLYYAEYNNTGLGVGTNGSRVTWPGYHVINSTDASNFTVNNFILGDAWLPQTGVPYLSGML